MPDSPLKIDVESWVEQARGNPTAHQRRQSIEIILNAIAAKSPLNKQMFLKGGILMGLAYDSPRQTVDIDLTTALKAEDDTGEWICGQLNQEFPRVADRLDYEELVLATQSAKWQRGGEPETAEFPALRIKVAYAQRGTNQEKALKRGRAANIIGIDISFNERLGHVQILEITGGQELFAYGLADLIAEKYRAVLQQVPRNRRRRQDIFDLDLLIAGHEIDDALRAQILETLIEKCRSRRLEPAQASLEDPEIKERSGWEWGMMELEVGEIPDFEDCFARVSEFYENLPWDGYV